MSGFKNLYEILRISPLATPEQIREALRNAAQNNRISLEDAQMVKSVLLNEETRKKYNAKLFAEYPEILQQIVDEKTKTEVKKQLKKQQQNSVESKEYKVKSTIKHKVIRYALLLVVILAVGAIPLYFYYIKPHMLFSKAEESVKAQLKDPDSAKFNKEKITYADGKKVVCGMVNAKNGMGGYEGYNFFIYFYDKDNSVLIPGDKPKEEDKLIYYSITWQVACNGMSKEKVKEWIIKTDELRKDMRDAQYRVEALSREEDLSIPSDGYDDEAMLDSWRQKIATEQESVNKIKEKLDDHIKQISIYKSTDNPLRGWLTNSLQRLM